MNDAGHESGARGPYQPGDRLGGGWFTLVEVLGQGGMGTVWLANDEQLLTDAVAVQVALKFITSVGPKNDELIRELKKEVLRAAMQLSHTNIGSS